MRTNKKALAVASIALAGVMALSGIAYAVFSATSSPANAGGGSGNLSALVVSGTTIDFSGSETKLWPNVDGPAPPDPTPETGLHVAKVNVHVTNNNEVPVKITGIVGTATFNSGAVQTQCGTYL